MLSLEKIRLLIIEDNQGDAFLIQEYLEEVSPDSEIVIVETFSKAKAQLLLPTKFDSIFLDLSLPDNSGEPLVKEVVALAKWTPVIVLTGYSDQTFGIKTLSLGVSDYLLKDELTAAQLTKSINYSIERKRIEQKLKKSNERYEILAQATSDTIWDWDILTGSFYSNNGITRVFGYSEEQIENTEKWWHSKIHPDDYENLAASLATNFEDGISLFQLEYRFRCADDSYKYVFDRAYLILDADKRPIRMIGAMQDITAKKEEEDKLRLLESVITNATDAILITEVAQFPETEYKIVFANEAFTKITGYSREEIIGKTTSILTGPNSDINELNKLSEAQANWETCNVVFVNYKKNGDTFWGSISVAPVADKKGGFTHWIYIQRDVTDRRIHLQSIEEQNKRLKEIAWTQSHLVRAPLARIMGLVSILKDHEMCEDFSKEEIIDNIATSADELDTIIRNIVQKTELIKNQV